MTRGENKKAWVVIVSWMAVLVWMGLIFYMSSQSGEQSGKLSTGITQFIVKTFRAVAPGVEPDMDMFNFMLRKNAHFLSYLVLGLLAMNALIKSGITGYRCIALAILISVLYSVSDEIHQLYVPGRSGQARDVLIDSAGSVIGIFLHRLFSKEKRKKQDTC